MSTTTNNTAIVSKKDNKTADLCKAIAAMRTTTITAIDEDAQKYSIIIEDGDKSISIDSKDAEKLGIENSTGIASLAEYSNIKNKSLSRAFSNIEKYKFAIRKSVCLIGRELFNIRRDKLYKDDYKELGMSTKSFDEFCKKVLGIPKTSAYRYIWVYSMCADAKGNVDDRILKLTNTQLFALQKAGATYSNIIALLEELPPEVENPALIETKVNELKESLENSETSQNETITADGQTVEDGQTATTADGQTATNADDTANIEHAIKFKCSISKMPPIIIPESNCASANLIYDYMTKSAYEVGGYNKEDLIFDVVGTAVMMYIIVHSTDCKLMLTYYYKSGKYSNE